MNSTFHWRLLQLADSGFPTGGFAHSAGLEAAVHLGQVKTGSEFVAYLNASMWNVGSAALPFVGAAHDAPGAVWELDGHLDAFLINHVTNRASRTQGRAFVATCERVFENTDVAALAFRVRSREVAAHLAPLFGASLAALGLERGEALGLFLYLALRGLASAAVRLGVMGPHEAQRIQTAFAPVLDAVLVRCSALRPDDASTTAPILDIVASTHDRLYARIFQS